MKFLLTLIIFVIIITGCNNSTGSEDYKPATDYSWQIDTLKYGPLQTLMESIYWVNSNNIYLAGFCSDSRGSIFHYDGTNWEYVPYHTNSGGTISGVVEFAYVFGFGVNDIWFAGYELSSGVKKPLVVHFDGNIWVKVPIIGLGSRGQSIHNIYGAFPSDIWFAGENGQLYHWNGADIRVEDLPVENYLPEDEIPNNWVTGNKNGYVFLNLANLRGPGLSFGSQLLSKKSGESWQIRTEVLNVANQIWMSPSNKVWAQGLEMRYFDDSKSEWVYLSFPHSSGINGPLDNNLLLCNPYEGRVYYYNGTSGTEIEDLYIPDAFYTATFYNGYEAVVLGTQNGVSVVAIGK